MRMAEISAQPRHVTSDALSIRSALLEGAHREGMSQIVQARSALAGRGTQPHATCERKEHRDHRRIFHRCSGWRDEHGVIDAGQLPSSDQIAFEGSTGAFMQGDESIFEATPRAA